MVPVSNRSYSLIAMLLLAFATPGMGMDRVHISLLGGDEGSLDAEVCFDPEISPDGDIPGSNWHPGLQLRRFIDKLEAGQNAAAFMISNGKTVEDSLQLPKAFYTELEGMRFRHALAWLDYVGLGVDYIHADGQTVRWREDFRCRGADSKCLLDFGFAGTNQVLETIYYRLIEATPRSTARTPTAFEIGSHVSLKPPFPQPATDTCPLRLFFALSRMSGGFCRGCKEPPDVETEEGKVGPTAEQLSRYLSQAFEDLHQGIGWAELATAPDADSIPVVNVGITGSMSGIALQGYLKYLADWQQARFLGFVLDAERYFVYVEFKRTQDDEPRLEVLRLRRADGDFEQDFAGTPSIEQNLIYEPELLRSVHSQFELNR